MLVSVQTSFVSQYIAHLEKSRLCLHGKGRVSHVHVKLMVIGWFYQLHSTPQILLISCLLLSLLKEGCYLTFLFVLQCLTFSLCFLQCALLFPLKALSF